MSAPAERISQPAQEARPEKLTLSPFRRAALVAFSVRHGALPGFSWAPAPSDSIEIAPRHSAQLLA